LRTQQDFAKDVIQRTLADGPLAELIPSRDAAFATVALYLGMQMLTHLNGDNTATESLFATGERVAALLAMPHALRRTRPP